MLRIVLRNCKQMCLDASGIYAFIASNLLWLNITCTLIDMLLIHHLLIFPEVIGCFRSFKNQKRSLKSSSQVWWRRGLCPDSATSLFHSLSKATLKQLLLPWWPTWEPCTYCDAPISHLNRLASCLLFVSATFFHELCVLYPSSSRWLSQWNALMKLWDPRRFPKSESCLNLSLLWQQFFWTFDYFPKSLELIETLCCTYVFFYNLLNNDIIKWKYGFFFFLFFVFNY